MARKAKVITACDCETDPFQNGLVIMPFIWGFYDGAEFRTFDSTRAFVDFIKTQDVICYAHNGGKFDFMYLLPYMGDDRTVYKAQIINGRIVSMMLGKCELVDSFAAVPESLKKIKKDDIKYWKMGAEVRADHMPEIIKYLKSDCVYLLELMTAYRKAAGTKKTIASNALAFAKKQGINPGTTNNRFDANYRPYYYGGRTQCFRPGTHKNFSVFDIKSCYPFAMLHDHATGADMKRRDDLGDLTREEIQRAFITLEGYSDGAFPVHTNGAQGLAFPHGHSRDVCPPDHLGNREFRVTGWEYIAAKELGLLREEKIKEVRYATETINFREYVMHWFKYKADYSAKDKDGNRIDPVNYTIGKILMNSLYGKLSQNPARYFDYKIMPMGSKLPCRVPDDDKGMPGVIPIDWKTQNCKICGFHELDHGWKLYTTFQGNEFHRRESLWKYQYRHNVEWEAKPLYKNVATGASITGFARAFLLRAIHTVGIGHIIYCDTDSMILDETADTSALPLSDKIGDWEIEIKRAPLGHFAGKKLYGIEKDPAKKCTCGDPEEDCKRHKVVSKGARLTFEDMAKLLEGETIVYNPRAPTFSIANGIGFVPRKIRRTA